MAKMVGKKGPSKKVSNKRQASTPWPLLIGRSILRADIKRQPEAEMPRIIRPGTPR
jgi:hypothetical protein